MAREEGQLLVAIEHVDAGLRRREDHLDGLARTDFLRDRYSRGRLLENEVVRRERRRVAERQFDRLPRLDDQVRRREGVAVQRDARTLDAVGSDLRDDRRKRRVWFLLGERERADEG